MQVTTAALTAINTTQAGAREGTRVLTFGIPDDPAKTVCRSSVLSTLQLTASVTSGVHVQGFASYKIMGNIAQVKTLPCACLGLVVDTV